MAKGIAKMLAVVSCLLLLAVIYFIQVNDDRMIILAAKLSIAVFLVFLFTSLIFRAMEAESKAWRLVAIIGGFALAYLIYLGAGEIGTQLVRYDQIAGVGDSGFIKFLIIGSLILAGLTALICGLAKIKGGQHVDGNN